MNNSINKVKTFDKDVYLDQLYLDPNNYRLLHESATHSVSDSEAHNYQTRILEELDKQRLDELIDSILENGFLQMERIVVRALDTDENNALPEDSPKKKYIVVEGNRRTAALKILLEEHPGSSLEHFLADNSDTLKVILIDGTEDDIDLYASVLMGVRHVSGPKKWDGFQSAKLINDIYEKHKFNYTKIGDLLGGLTPNEVGRRFRGYKAFLQLKSHNVYKDKVESRHYALLLEFLSSKGREWLEWNDNLFMFENTENLEIVFERITASKEAESEIRNSTDARKLIYLVTSGFEEDIKKGRSIHELPDPEDLKPSGKEKRIKSFKLFVEKGLFEDVELELLGELQQTLRSILDGKDA